MEAYDLELEQEASGMNTVLVVVFIKLAQVPVLGTIGVNSLPLSSAVPVSAATLSV